MFKAVGTRNNKKMPSLEKEETAIGSWLMNVHARVRMKGLVVKTSSNITILRELLSRVPVL